MLLRLTIQNYALIEKLEMDFSNRLNVITGETGTGKSIVLGALGLLLGSRVDTKTLLNKNEKCIVEGDFKIKDYQLEEVFQKEDLDYDDHTILRREIIPKGKSRAFINDTPVTLEIIKKIGSQLMDIHAQHEIMDLKNRSYPLQIVDLYAANKTVKEDYKKIWEKLISIQKEYTRAQEEANLLRQESDYIAYQLEEFSKAGLEEEGELNQLENDMKLMEHAEDIKIKFNTTLDRLHDSEFSTDAILREVRTPLHELSHYSEPYKKLYERFENTRIELQDLVEEIRLEESKIEFDQKKIEAAKERFDFITGLLHKHQCSSIAQLIQLQKDLQDKMDKYEHVDNSLASIKQKKDNTEVLLQKQAKKLSDSRTVAFPSFCKNIIHLLHELSIPHGVLRVAHHNVPAGPTGADSVDLLFSANKGVVERPIAQVASGGEFSRLMFCIKCLLAEKAALPTLILDEIDSGISGEVAVRLGNRMKTVANRLQLIVISHLPQIAAKADKHFYVYKETTKEKTYSRIKNLSKEDQITIIAKMISGKTPSSSAIESAKELIKS